jgi:hypothetical protein
MLSKPGTPWVIEIFNIVNSVLPWAVSLEQSAISKKGSQISDI